MKRTSQVFTLAVALACAGAWAQAPAKNTAAQARSSAASTVTPSTAGLPSEATVNSFIKRMFGYEESLTWKITSIAPAAAPGLAEVNVVFSSPQGQQQARFFVTADGQHAIMGDLIPFGSDPFAATRQKLLASQTGLSTGPADAKLVLVEFADLECPGGTSAQSTMTKLQEDFPNARFVFQN
jgi:protein-disulfide isomerase